MRTGLEAWASELGALSDVCERGREADAPEAVRKIYSLLAGAPKPADALFVGIPSSERIHTFLSGEAPDQAALAILHERAGYMLSRSLEGFCLATVVLIGRNDEQSLIASTPALALIGAFSRALQARFSARDCSRLADAV